jgi:ribonuclease kappa
VMGSEEDPKDGGAVAGAVFGAVFIYIVRKTQTDAAFWPILIRLQGFFVFCGFQAFLHFRESRRGAISLS